MQPVFGNNSLVLFQGDSITFADRKMEDEADMGRGYAHIASAWLGALYPNLGTRFLNRGIGGNTVVNLAERWNEDCLDINPDWLSVLIGINDAWQNISLEQYESVYRDILEQAKAKCGARFILMEPFLLPGPVDYAEKRSIVDGQIEIVHRISKDFDAILIEVDGIFRRACSEKSHLHWALPDGVHPTPAGHALIAQYWLRAVSAI